ncbi:MAG: MCE family protein [Sphingomonadaceae bacterium]|nr:MCE family protein [Sphingomonadaceae bacterium]
MENRSNQILVGGVVLGLLVLVALFFVWFAGLGGGVHKPYDIYFEQSVEGLNRGSSVTYSGVPAGEVVEIELVPNNPGVVRVRIHVEEDVPVLRGTTATVQGIGFTGVSQVTLGGGRQGAGEITEPGPDGVPVIPTRPGALGELLTNAPRLLERLTGLTERLALLLSDRNQASIAGILENTEVLTREISARSPEIAATLAEMRVAIQRAGAATEEIGELADTTDRLLTADGQALMRDLRSAVASAETSMDTLNATIGDARPGLQAFSQQTIPELGELIRDLRVMTDSLGDLSRRAERNGAGSIIGGQRLPDYVPE